MKTLRGAAPTASSGGVRTAAATTASDPGWNQKWRGPLRKALDRLRDAVRPLWQHAATPLFRDPEAARDGYIQVLLDRSAASQQAFFDEYCTHALSQCGKDHSSEADGDGAAHSADVHQLWMVLR